MLPPFNPSIENPISFISDNQSPDTAESSFGKDGLSDVFDLQLQKDKKVGAQITVLKDGEVEIDRCGGIADLRNQVPVTYSTRFQAFSITKSLIAACIFKLIDQGLISLDSKVADYWPAFGTHGKSGITIRQVLLHQAGLPRRELFDQILHSKDWDRITHNLAKQKPEYPPGEKTAYHTLNFGYILGEVIRRVSGSPVNEFLRSEFTKPLGMDDTSMTISDSSRNSSARLSSGTIDQHHVALLYNSTKVRQSVIPGGSLHTTARDLAVFFQMLLNEGRYAGMEFLAPETVRLATSLGFEGFDASYGRLTRWGFGFNLGGEHDLNPELPDGMGAGSSIDTFGHFGQRTCMAWADKRERLVVVFLCNRFLSHQGYKYRLRSISDAAWEFCQE